ncbi:hypothetical protein [Bartonella massiliensis]|uniref:hypothetical protein n=1 Tax=Bartonella massiliensis TaxID=929795 RepID=UPI00115B51E6|nr:hypothetical protein [Bartonella massiliensis]
MVLYFVFVVIGTLAISLTACGGRLEKNISTTTLHDGTMSCADIQQEFYANKRQINDTIVERSKAILSDLARMKRCKIVK